MTVIITQPEKKLIFKNIVTEKNLIKGQFIDIIYYS